MNDSWIWVMVVCFAIACGLPGLLVGDNKWELLSDLKGWGGLILTATVVLTLLVYFTWWLLQRLLVFLIATPAAIAAILLLVLAGVVIFKRYLSRGDIDDAWF